MRYLLVFILVSLFSLTHAQEKSEEKKEGKYPSLFWKIEGKDLKKPSYLYGTMHVSHKIAYHLSDDFYKALKEVDQIALETNPETWMDKMLERSGGGGYYGYSPNLYSSFAPIIPEDKDIEYILQLNNQLVNGILYRNNEYQQNFEEETYLDMFIFQAGGKQGKPVVALEDLDESDDLARKASMNSYDPDRELPQWLKKELQEKGIVELMEDAYRDKDLDFIDSLNRVYYTDLYNQYMLYDRNRNMVEALDTVFQKGSVFIGIGAAHLPGEQGVIEMLREEGYTVTPIKGEQTEVGKKIKEDFESTFSNRTHSSYSSTDDFIKVDLPEKLYEFGVSGRNIGVGMDITNGAYFLILRTTLNHSFSEEPISLDDVEKMLYENIPGKISTQERITFQGYPAIALTNKTKNGEHQRYLIVETPLELIVFKLGGKKDYASKHGHKFFDNIKLGKQSSKKTKVSPFYGDFQVEMPGTPIIQGNNEVMSGAGTVMIESYDNKTKAKYFASAMVYHDYRYFEDDDFEVEYMHKAWYDEIDTLYNYIQTTSKPYYSALSGGGLKNGEKVWLKTIKKGPKYYMLGTIGSDSLQSIAFFNSFTFVDVIHEDEKYELQVDTSLYYEVISSIETPQYYDYYGRRNKKEDTIKSKYKSIQYETPYKEVIDVSYNKYHHYYQTEHADSIWLRIKKSWTGEDYKDIDDEDRYIVYDEDQGKNKKEQPYYSFKIKKDGCSRMIQNHYILNHGVMYLVRWDSDIYSDVSPFAQKFIETFTLKDTLIGRDPFQDKAGIFFENIHSEDSLTRIQALESYDYIDFKEAHVPQLMDVIKNFEFDEKELDIKVGLLEALGQIEDPRVFPFFKRIYSNSEYNSAIQLEVINALAKNPNKENYDLILYLMDADLPLASERTIYNTFSPLRDSSALAFSKGLFPKLLEYSSIPEYQTWIYQLAEKLKNEDQVKGKMFKKYKKQFVNEMKMEFKRQKTKDIENKSKSYNYGGSSSGSLLDEYMAMLIHYYKNPEVKDIFDKIKTLEDARNKSLLLAQLSKHNQAIDKELLNELAEDPKTRYELYENLEDLKQLDIFPAKYNNQKDLAESYLLGSRSYPKIDSIEFYKEITIKEQDDEYILYFFKSLKKSSSYYDEDKEGEWGLQYIAYEVKKEKDEKTKEFIPDNYYSKSSYKEIDFEDEEELKEYEEEIIDTIKYKKRKRVRSRDSYYGY